MRRGSLSRCFDRCGHSRSEVLCLLSGLTADHKATSEWPLSDEQQTSHELWRFARGNCRSLGSPRNICAIARVMTSASVMRGGRRGSCRLGQEIVHARIKCCDAGAASDPTSVNGRSLRRESDLQLRCRPLPPSPNSERLVAGTARGLLFSQRRGPGDPRGHIRGRLGPAMGAPRWFRTGECLSHGVAGVSKFV